jgi:uncharacterized protein YgbK (DUF1537 family)
MASQHETRINQAELFASLSPIWPEDPLPAIEKLLKEGGEQVFVLDDDPTGTATVHDLPALTEWTVDALSAEMKTDYPCVYLATNSRAMPLAEAIALNREVGHNLVEASRRTGRPFVVVSRSDSTLRGHYPGEVDALAEALGGEFDITIITPALFAGHRLTVKDIHYAGDGTWLIPAGETEFARDASFGFQASNLREWVAEKTEGKVPADKVASLTLDMIRQGGSDKVTEFFMDLESGSVCVLNAAVERDLAVATLGIMQAEAQGRRFLYRTAASFIPFRIAQESQPLLTAEKLELPESGAGGLVVVGSYVPKTTSQIQHLLANTDITGVEIQVDALLSDVGRAEEIARVTQDADAALQRGEDVVIYTSRKLITGSDAVSSLAIGKRVSESLTTIVGAIKTRPRYLMPKGGITSSVVATDSMKVKRAMVLGAILPGVPVWRLGEESRHPGLVYVVYPGNVGGADALTRIVTQFKRSAKG